MHYWHRFWILIVFTVTMAILAMQSPKDSTAAPHGLFRLAGVDVGGRLTSERSGDPIAGAYVVAEAVTGSAVTVVTDSRGRYALKNLPRGRYLITAFGPGYSRRTNLDTLLIPDDALYRLNFVLSPLETVTVAESIEVTTDPVPGTTPGKQGSIIRGRVSDHEGPLAGVMLVAISECWDFPFRTFTDSTGRFMLYLSDSCRAGVWVRAPARGAAYIGDRNGWQRGQLDLHGHELELTLDPQPHGPWHIAGQIDASGGLLAAAWLEATDQDGRVRDIAPVESGGGFRLAGLTSGFYRINLRRPGKQGLLLGGCKIEQQSVDGCAFRIELASR